MWGGLLKHPEKGFSQAGWETQELRESSAPLAPRLWRVSPVREEVVLVTCVSSHPDTVPGTWHYVSYQDKYITDHLLGFFDFQVLENQLRFI